MQAGQVRAAFCWTPLGRSKPTVSNFNLNVDAGERILLVGRSGSGKSTVLHALAGALGATIAGELTGSIKSGGQLGYIAQNPTDGIVAEQIGRDIAFGPENVGLGRVEIHRRIEQAMAEVSLTYPVTHQTSALSGGEQQRLALAAVLALRPDLVLLDEPTSMLDDIVARQVRDAVVRAVGDRTMIVVEHRFEPWLEYVDRVVVMDAGQVVLDGTVAEFLAAAPPGLWLPGRPAPEPAAISLGLVAPSEPSEGVSLEGICVDLTTRTLRGNHVNRVLTDISAHLHPGKVSAFVGPSGSGKSTALLSAAGLLKPAAGQVTPDRSRLRSRRLAAGLGWVPQNPEHGFVATTVRREIETTAAKVGREVDVDSVLEAVGLNRYGDSHPYRLSGGEQRRLALVAALAHRPDFVVLDEPTVGQDHETWALVVGWLSAAATAGATVAISTHDRFIASDTEFVLEQAGRLRQVVSK
ncbi:MAG TPA: ATP-binding cassette domain-containing protein [Aeromicrobium sp.]|nr:ATP-binding cassette domain-containing protein [Aeromicrobium sp.]